MAAMMPGAPASEDMMEEPGAETQEAAGAGDLSQGYVIEVTCKSDGTFVVTGPEPVQEEAVEENAGGEGDMAEGEVLDSIGAALKEVLRITKENPMSGGEAENMEAGYGAG